MSQVEEHKHKLDRPPERPWFANAIALIVLVPLYFFAWPLIAFFLFLAFFPGCTGGDCRSVGTLLADISSGVLVVVTLLILALFGLSLFSKPNSSNLRGAFILSYRYACLFAPGAAGGEGFGLAVPFWLGALINLPSQESLRIPLIFFATTWSITLPALLCIYLFKSFSRRGHSNISRG